MGPFQEEDKATITSPCGGQRLPGCLPWTQRFF
uniref:Uncharacterized protein n=1 Tax=Rhinopithecus bieti TaxID=61621 RepID=A0A2K6LJE4_RHIBE